MAAGCRAVRGALFQLNAGKWNNRSVMFTDANKGRVASTADRASLSAAAPLWKLDVSLTRLRARHSLARRHSTPETRFTRESPQEEIHGTHR